MQPKSKGTACMASMTNDEVRGPGFPMTAAEITLVNRSRLGEDSAILNASGGVRKKLDLTQSPGISLVRPAKDGNWGLEHLQVQAENILDCYKVLYPRWQVVG